MTNQFKTRPDVLPAVRLRGVMVVTYGAAYAVNQKHTPKQIILRLSCGTLTHATTIMSLLWSYNFKSVHPLNTH